MQVVDAIKGELLPRTKALIAHLELYGNPQAERFFTSIRDYLCRVEEEDDLAEFFMALSTAAFQGLVLDPKATHMADDILMRAGSLARTLGADPGSVN